MLKAPTAVSFFLFGPRGTGKSTWVRSQFPQAVVVDLLDHGTFTELSAHPEHLARRVPEGFTGHILLDEIQKIPALLDEVHRLMESRRWTFVLTGSSARKLRRGGVNLLAGRARTLTLPPLTAAELGSSFRIEHSLRFGHLPLACLSEDPGDYLQSYVGTYLREEVHQEALVRNLGAFARFLQAASFSQGAVLNVSAVATECGIPRKTVESHFDLVEDLLLGHRLPVFRRRAQRKVILHPKFYFFDAGVFRAIRPRGPLDSEEETDGAALETLVYQELRATNANLKLEYELSYWRTPQGHEVDFVAYGPRGLLAFEVKRARRLRNADFRAMRMFLSDFPPAKGFVLYGGDQRLFLGDRLEAWPVADALRNMPALLGNAAEGPSSTDTPVP